MLKIRVKDSIKQAFLKYCESQDLNMSEVIRAFMIQKASELNTKKEVAEASTVAEVTNENLN